MSPARVGDEDFDLGRPVDGATELIGTSPGKLVCRRNSIVWHLKQTYRPSPTTNKMCRSRHKARICAATAPREGATLPVELEQAPPAKTNHAVLVGQSEPDIPPRNPRWLSLVAQAQRQRCSESFYESMREVQPGDLIFSFVDTRIFAVGIAQSYCWESPKPLEFGNAGQNWENIGWRVKVDFTEFSIEIPSCCNLYSSRMALLAFVKAGEP